MLYLVIFLSLQICIYVFDWRRKEKHSIGMWDSTQLIRTWAKSIQNNIIFLSSCNANCDENKKSPTQPTEFMIKKNPNILLLNNNSPLCLCWSFSFLSFFTMLHEHDYTWNIFKFIFMNKQNAKCYSVASRRRRTENKEKKERYGLTDDSPSSIVLNE